MYNYPYSSYPYIPNVPINHYRSYPAYGGTPNQMPVYYNHPPFYHPYRNDQNMSSDFGGRPFVTDINQATLQNDTFRTAVWTGEHLQLTLMSIDVGDDIGLEMHPDVDQFLRIEQGEGIVQMGPEKDQVTFQQNASDDYAVFIPAGTWHNLTNTGNVPLKFYSIYAPPNHPFGTVHKTKADAIAAE
ncbi:cupin domain-containing protein [Halobacillus locisalis]|uniref:Cupin domain-containing protein n=1 Tax=Halobacillus locisalis TaxID=220753 RepID=A0A838CQY2_9BACI|nr:cupin domain-containing protein [Halobacillus locisalis]MBA2174229.1 cupin domain-containing protein [Halobacillus locisalis]